VIRAERMGQSQAASGEYAKEASWGVAVQFIGRPTVDLASLFFESTPAGHS